MRRIITASNILNRPVMAVETATELGKVSGFAIDPDTCRMAAVRYGESRVLGLPSGRFWLESVRMP